MAASSSERRPLVGVGNRTWTFTSKKVLAASLAALCMVGAIATVAAMVHESSPGGVPGSLLQLTPSHVELHRMSDMLQNSKAYVTGLWSRRPPHQAVKPDAKTKTVVTTVGSNVRQAHLAAHQEVENAHHAGKVAYVYVPDKAHAGKAAKGSKLQHLAASVHHAQAPVQAHAEQASDTTMLGQPPPGTYIAPAVGGGPVCDIWHLEQLSDDTQIAWDKCMHNKNYKEPNSIAQEIYDELDETEDGEVSWQEYCRVAREHTARLTDDQCKEIIKLMDEAAGDNDGVLQYSEFKAAFLKGQEPPEEEEEEERRRRRHLLGWVWVPGKGQEPGTDTERAAKLKEHKKNFFGTSLATFHRVAVDMATCKKQAVGDTCEYIGKCSQPVCNQDTMYNNTKVEALCGICVLAGQQGEAGASGGLGCFALEGQVDVEGRGKKQIAELAAGDRIAAAARRDGSIEYSRVLFTHEHIDAMQTVKLSAGGDQMELTSAHQVPLYTEACGARYCPAAKLVKAAQVQRGDQVYVSDGKHSSVKTVTDTSPGYARVKYIVTEAGTLVVNGVVASVFSTPAAFWETLPFQILDSLFKDVLQWAPVSAALFTVLESPALRAVESLIDMIVISKSRGASALQPVAARVHVGSASF